MAILPASFKTALRLKPGHIKKPNLLSGQNGFRGAKSRVSALRSEEKISRFNLLGEHLSRVFMLKCPQLYKAAQAKVAQAIRTKQPQEDVKRFNVLLKADIQRHLGVL